MGTPLDLLNEKGITKFKEYLQELREGSTREPPYELLTDPWYSSKMPGGIEVEKIIFQSKKEAAKCFFEKLHFFPHSQIDRNVGLWSWLSLYYFEQVCPKNNLGRRIPGRDCRHILDLDYRHYYYHLLIGPYNIYRIHGEEAPLLLYGPINETGKYYLELSARQGFITNKGIIEAANLLYFDTGNGRPKRGAALTSRKPGTLVRFIDVVQQLDLTYDLHSMTGEEIVALLPPEFDEWRKDV
jgi:hypothetical protein